MQSSTSANRLYYSCSAHYMLSVLNMFISFSPSIPLLPKKSKGSDCSLLKTNKQARLVERKVGFISDVDYWGREVGGRLTKSRLPSSTTANQWGKSFYRQKLRGTTCRKIAQTALTVIFKLVISIVFVVLGTVSLQFQGWLVSMSLTPVLGTVAAFDMGVVHWRREWQTTSVFSPGEPHEQYEKAKR